MANDFYQEMGAFVRDILQPTSAGGLGQGQIVLKRITPGTPDQAAPWIPAQPQVTTQTLKGAVRGVDGKMIGVEMGGTVILPSDRVAITEVPSIEYEAGDVLEVDGKEVQILGMENIPAAGIASAVKWVIR